MLKYRSFYSRGFTLIEVLISMVVLAVGLLGLAAMQAMSLRDNQDAYYYQQATLLTYEMQDRIMVNQDYWANAATSNSIPSPSQGNSCNSATDPCSPADMAAYDYWYWEDSVKKTFPAPKTATNSVVDIQLSNTISDEVRGACNGANTKPESLCLMMHWGRTNVKTTGKLSGDASFYLEITPSL
ncbi:MAG: type IV pilus modification protein PilV [Methylococcaceae bacterium]